MSGLENNITPFQLRSWLLVAVVPAILGVVGRNGWPTVLLTACVSGAVCCCISTFCSDRLPKWLCNLELIWLTVFLGKIAQISTGCWESAKGMNFIPAFLLALAAWTANKGLHRSARVGVTLQWLVLPVLAVVLLSGTVDVHLKWIRTEWEIPDGTLVAILLFPCAMVFVPLDGKRLRYSGFLLGVVAVVSTVLIQGILGSGISGNTIYKFSKGITLFGIAERFEALISCALTIGMFAFMVLILSMIQYLTKKVFPAFAEWGIWLYAAVAYGVMCILPNNQWLMPLGGVIFWGLLPAVTQGIGSQKIIEKK